MTRLARLDVEAGQGLRRGGQCKMRSEPENFQF